MHRGHDDGASVDQPGLGRQRELEVAESPALAEPCPRLVDGDAAGDHEVDRFELVERDRARAARGALDRARGARIVGQLLRIEEEERIALGEAWHRHVDDLAVDERALTHRPLRRIGIRLQRRRRRPLIGLGEAARRGLGADEVGDAVRGLREPRDSRPVEIAPHLLAQRGFRREQV